MTVELLLERTPGLEAELRRDFRPLEIVEGNFAYNVLNSETGRVTLQWRRQRQITYVKSDQNTTAKVVTDLGPATYDGQFVMPCSDEVEMAQAIELIEWGKREAAQRREREAWVKPLRTAAWLKALQESNEEAQRRATGASTFGPSHKVQREAS